MPPAGPGVEVGGSKGRSNCEGDSSKALRPEWAGGTERRKHVYFLKYIDYAITVALFFPSFLPPPPFHWYLPLPLHVHVHGTYEFFGVFKNILFSERERTRKDQCVVASPAPPTGDWACNRACADRLGIDSATFCFTVRRSIH